jgi:amino acid transporter
MSTNTTSTPSTALRRNAVGVAGILFFVLSAQAPLTGIAGALPVAILLGNGAGAPAAYLMVGGVIILFAVGFIAMSRHVSDSGAFYTYVSRGLGRRVGTGASQVALLSYSTIQAAMYGLYGVVVSGLANTHLSLDLPWWVWALVTMAVVQALGSLNIELGAKFLAVLVIAEFGILLAFAVVEFVTGGGPEGLDPGSSFSPDALMAGAPGVALTFAIASMFGFESTAIYAEEAKDPARTIPRATYFAVCTIAIFFAFVSWMVVSHYGAGNATAAAEGALASGDSTSLVFAAIADTLGTWTIDIAGVLLATSLLAGILAFHNGINRYFHSLSEAGVFHGRIASTNKQGAPYIASAIQTLVAAALVIPFAVLDKDPVLTLFSWFSGLAVLALVVLYFLTSVSVVVYFRRSGLDRRLWNTLIAPVASAVLIVAGTVLVLRNLPTLIGGSTTTATVLAATVPVVFAGGWALGHLRGHATEAGHMEPDTGGTAPATVN